MSFYNSILAPESFFGASPASSLHSSTWPHLYQTTGYKLDSSKHSKEWLGFLTLTLLIFVQSMIFPSPIHSTVPTCTSSYTKMQIITKQNKTFVFSFNFSFANTHNCFWSVKLFQLWSHPYPNPKLCWTHSSLFWPFMVSFIGQMTRGQKDSLSWIVNTHPVIIQYCSN